MAFLPTDFPIEEVLYRSNKVLRLSGELQFDSFDMGLTTKNTKGKYTIFFYPFVPFVVMYASLELSA